MARRRKTGRKRSRKKTKMSEIMRKIARGKRLTKAEREYLKRRR